MASDRVKSISLANGLDKPEIKTIEDLEGQEIMFDELKPPKPIPEPKQITLWETKS